MFIYLFVFSWNTHSKVSNNKILCEVFVKSCHFTFYDFSTFTWCTITYQFYKSQKLTDKGVTSSKTDTHISLLVSLLFHLDNRLGKKRTCQCQSDPIVTFFDPIAWALDSWLENQSCGEAATPFSIAIRNAHKSPKQHLCYRGREEVGWLTMSTNRML
jgi:hypothetical protein